MASFRVLVSNIAPQLGEEQIKEIFSGCGEVKSLSLQGGACTIEFGVAEHAKAAILLSGFPLGHHKLQVVELADTSAYSAPAAAPAAAPTAPATSAAPPPVPVPTPLPAGSSHAAILEDAMARAQAKAKEAKAVPGNSVPLLGPPPLLPGGPGLIPMMPGVPVLMPGMMVPGRPGMMPGMLPMPVVQMGGPMPTSLTAAGQKRADEIARTIYVGNLSDVATESHMKQFFARAGPISFVKVSGNNDAGRHGFIEFRDQQSATNALALSGQILVDKPVKIGRANNPIVKPASTELGEKALSAAMRKVREQQERLAAKFGSGGADSKEANGKAKGGSASKSRSRSRDRGSRKRRKYRRSRSRSRRRRRSRSRSHGRRRRRRRYSRSRSRSRRRRSRSRGRHHRRRRSRSPRRKAKAPSGPDRSGQFWDGFQWQMLPGGAAAAAAPAAAATPAAAAVPTAPAASGVGAGPVESAAAPSPAQP